MYYLELPNYITVTTNHLNNTKRICQKLAKELKDTISPVTSIYSIPSTPLQTRPDQTTKQQLHYDIHMNGKSAKFLSLTEWSIRISHMKNNDTFHIICQFLFVGLLSINTPILAELKKFVTVQINGISFWLPPLTFSQRRTKPASQPAAPDIHR